MAKQQRRLTIGMDLDGCWADFTGQYIKVMKRIAPDVKLPEVPYTDWNWADRYYSQADLAAAKVSTYENDRFWFGLPRLATDADVQELIKLSMEHNVYFVTSRPPQMLDATVMWVENTLKIRSPQVAISHAKGPMAAGLGLDVMVEDNLRNLIEIRRSVGSKCLPVLIDQPYNQSEQLLDGRVNFSHDRYINRVYSMTEALQAVRKLEVE